MVPLTEPSYPVDFYAGVIATCAVVLFAKFVTHHVGKQSKYRRPWWGVHPLVDSACDLRCGCAGWAGRTQQRPRQRHQEAAGRVASNNPLYTTFVVLRDRPLAITNLCAYPLPIFKMPCATHLLHSGELVAAATGMGLYVAGGPGTSSLATVLTAGAWLGMGYVASIGPAQRQ